jgi:3-keto-disaccharide hydrolase
MLIACLLAAASIAATTTTFAQESAPPPILGRWDLTIHTSGGDRSGWLEVRHSGLQTLVGQFVGTSGSARPISQVEFKDNELRFSIPPQWDRVDGNLVVTGRLDGDHLSGTMTLAGGPPDKWDGVRAPSLRRSEEPKWGEPLRLLQANSLDGWHAIGANEWEVAGGVLKNRKSGGNLVTDQTFTDFRLHLEFRYPAGSNSGVYLRGRYEVQIADLPDAEPEPGMLGAIYGFISPSENASRKAGEWQSYDITLVGRMVTVVLNDKTLICNQAIPGITGAALDSDEGKPGPLLLQGDHGPIEFRNIVLTPAR